MLTPVLPIPEPKRLTIGQSSNCLFLTTHRVKTQQVARNRGQWCGDIEFHGHKLPAGPVPLVLDLHISHERFGSNSDHSINGHLNYPHDLDGPLNECDADKIQQYRTDYNNRPPTDIFSTKLCLLLLVRLGVYIVNLPSCSPSIFTNSSGNWPLFCSFRISASTIQLWPVPLPPHVWCFPHTSNPKWTTSSSRL